VSKGATVKEVTMKRTFIAATLVALVFGFAAPSMALAGGGGDGQNHKGQHGGKHKGKKKHKKHKKHGQKPNHKSSV
jgi:hypothetical protein